MNPQPSDFKLVRQLIIGGARLPSIVNEGGATNMADVRVTCINKQPRQNPYEGITHLGGVNWRWTREQVITSINAQTNTFYTLADGNRGDIGVVNGPNGPYLRTYADGRWNDNLLSLPECAQS